MRRKGKEGTHERKSGRKIKVTSSLNTEGKKLPMRGKGKGGTHEGNIEEVNNGYVVFKYRGKNSP